MRLHKDGKAFQLLLDNIHERTGYRTDVLEKDYYVVLILQELAGFQADGLPGVAPTEFTFFTQVSKNKDIRKAYSIMQNQYVLRNQDRIEFETAMKVLTKIHSHLLENTA